MNLPVLWADPVNELTNVFLADPINELPMFYGLSQLMNLPVLWADPVNEFTSFMG